MTDALLRALLAPLAATAAATAYTVEQTLHVPWDAEQALHDLTQDAPVRCRSP
jgi:hypothetical protein